MAETEVPEITYTSGVPDNAEPIWNEKNELVEPEMKAHFEEAAEAILQPVAYSSEFVTSLDSAKEYQQQEGQTRDVMTSPAPSADPNQLPTEITIPEPEEAPEGQVSAGQQSSGGGGSPSAPAPAPSVPNPPAPVSGESGTDGE